MGSTTGKQTLSKSSDSTCILGRIQADPLAKLAARPGASWAGYLGKVFRELSDYNGRNLGWKAIALRVSVGFAGASVVGQAGNIE